MRTKIFTAYEKNDAADPSDRIALVREGFSWGAFIFGVLWLVYRGLWLALVGYVVLIVAMVAGANYCGLGEGITTALLAFLQLLLGFAAYDVMRWSLKRQGYHFKNIVVAESPLNAARRYHDVVA